MISLITLVALLLCLPIGFARAQTRGTRAMRSIKIDASESGWALALEFEFPIRYLRHTPQTPGRTLRIQVAPVARGGDDLPDAVRRQSLPIAGGSSSPLVQVLFAGTSPDDWFVELQFSQSLAFAVEQGGDLRTLRIRAELPAAKIAPDGDPRVTALLVRARHAIRDGDLDLAIALLTRVLELPVDDVPVEQRMDARELLGVTHERRGQVSHAMDQYQAYLDEFPEGPAAIRVSQRLETLRTAAARPGGALRPSTRPALDETGGTVLREAFGSLGARYYRAETREDETDLRFEASDLLTDVDVTGQLEAESWTLRGDLAGTYDLDLSDQGRSDDVRISRLAARVDDRKHGLEATFGRQRRSDGGVLGRFDGLQAAARLGQRFKISAVAGLPVERSSDAVPDVERWLFGSAVDFEDVWLEGLQGQLFAIGQRSYSMTDRAAIGAELRYSSASSYSFVYLDYDFVFGSLNTFIASSTWRPSETTDVRATLDRRNAPVLTLASALQGQFADDLGDLKDDFSESEIRDLAEDRTSVAWSGTLGVTHRPTDRLQVSADLLVNQYSGTDTSGGVEGTEDSGPNFGGTLQFVLSQWLVESGVGSASLRYFEGDVYRSFMTQLQSRFAFVQSLRGSPRLRWEYRDSTLNGARSVLRPSFELDWRHQAWLLSGEAGFEWQEPITGSLAVQQLGYFLMAGVRWEF